MGTDRAVAVTLARQVTIHKWFLTLFTYLPLQNSTKTQFSFFS